MSCKSRIAFLLCITCTFGLTAQSHQLRYNLKKGTKYRFYQETQMTITQKLGIIDQEIKNEFNGIMRFEPIGNEGDNIILSTSFETMVINIESMMFNVSYDSSKPVDPNDNVAKIYSGIIGKNFKMIITPQGKVVRIEGINKLINNAVDGMGDVDPKTASQLRKTLTGHFGEEALMGNMGMLLSIYPLSPKSIGDQWSTNTQLTSALKANLVNNWTFSAANGDEWKLNGEGKISTLNEEASMNGMKVTFNLNGKQTSEFKLNKKDGWFISGKQNQEVKGSIFMKGNAQMPQGMEIPMQVKSYTYLEKR